MRTRNLAVAALLGTTLVGTPLRNATAQTDTIPRRPLFTYRDAILAGAFVVGTVAVFPFDKHYAIQLQDTSRQDSRFYNDVANTVRTIAEPGAWIIGGSMYAVGRIAHVPRMADLGWHGTEAVLVGGILGGAIKGVAGRGRPYLSVTPDGKPNPHDFQLFRGFTKGNAYESFPSGHAIAAFAAASAVSNETSRWWPQTRWIIGPAMYGGATLVGLSRMYNNKHWASDVLLGAAIGTFAGNKVVRYHHSHHGNRLDRWILGANVAPAPNGGWALSWSVEPGSWTLRSDGSAER